MKAPGAQEFHQCTPPTAGERVRQTFDENRDVNVVWIDVGNAAGEHAERAEGADNVIRPEHVAEVE